MCSVTNDTGEKLTITVEMYKEDQNVKRIYAVNRTIICRFLNKKNILEFSGLRDVWARFEQDAGREPARCGRGAGEH